MPKEKKKRSTNRVVRFLYSSFLFLIYKQVVKSYRGKVFSFKLEVKINTKIMLYMLKGTNVNHAVWLL